MEFHLSASSMSAPALSAIICFLIFKGSTCSLAKRHLLDVCTLLHRGWKPAGFGVEPCFRLYLSAFPKAFAFSNLFLPSLHQHALRFACLTLLQAKDGVITFHTVDPMDDLGGISTPGVLKVPCRQLRDLHPDFHAANSGKRPET